MSRHRLCALAMFLFGALIFGACGGSDDTGGDSSAAAAEGSTSGTVVGTVDGGQFDFNDLNGQPALIWFWAPW